MAVSHWGGGTRYKSIMGQDSIRLVVLSNSYNSSQEEIKKLCVIKKRMKHSCLRVFCAQLACTAPKSNIFSSLKDSKCPYSVSFILYLVQFFPPPFIVFMTATCAEKWRQIEECPVSRRGKF